MGARPRPGWQARPESRKWGGEPPRRGGAALILAVRTQVTSMWWGVGAGSTLWQPPLCTLPHHPHLKRRAVERPECWARRLARPPVSAPYAATPLHLLAAARCRAAALSTNPSACAYGASLCAVVTGGRRAGLPSASLPRCDLSRPCAAPSAPRARTASLCSAAAALRLLGQRPQQKRASSPACAVPLHR